MSDEGIEFGKYLQELLTAVGSIFLALFLLGLCWTFRGGSASTQTGLMAVVAGLVESALSGWFWAAFIPCFTWLFAARRASRRSVRVILFWVPAVAASVCGIALWLGILILLRHIAAR